MSLLSRSACWLVVLLGSTCAIAQAAPPYRLPRAVERRLDNAMHVIVVPRAGEGIVVQVGLPLGPYVEGSDAGSGISELLARLIVSDASVASDSDDPPDIRYSVAPEMTTFTIEATEEDLVRDVGRLAACLHDTKFSQDAVDRERDLLLEAQDSAATPQRRARELLFATLYPDDAAVVGFEPRRCRALDAADVLAFRKVHYVPGNAVVCVVGNVDAGWAFNRVAEAFGDWPSSRLPPPVRVGATLGMGGSSRVTTWDGSSSAPSDQGAFAVGWPIPMLTPDESVALELLVDRLRYLLTAGDGFVEVDLQRPPSGGGMLSVVSAGSLALEGAELGSRLGDGDPLTEDLERARQSVRADLESCTATNGALAAALASDYLRTDDSRQRERTLRRLDRLQLKDVAAVVERYLDPGRAVFVDLRQHQDARGEEREEAQPEEDGAAATSVSAPPAK